MHNKDKKVKVLLLFPNFQMYEIIGVDATQPPLSLGYLAGMLKANNIEYTVIDAACLKLNEHQIIQRIREFNPDVICITTNIAIAYASLLHSQLIRKEFPDIKIIIGGPWATAEYEKLLKNKHADYVIIGEGEYTLIELIKDVFESGLSPNHIKSLAYLENNTVKVNERRPLIEKLDDIPFPDWTHFPKKGYTKLSRVKPVYPILTSRGCPYECINCTKLVHGTRMRYRSVENVLAELDYLESIGAKEISIEDDVFNINKRRAKRILLEIAKRKYPFKIQLANGIRADFVDELFAKLAYAAGVYKTAFGVESGSQVVVNFLKKRLDLKVLPKSIDILHKAHIKVTGYFIFGLPIENMNSLVHTVNFASKLKFDSVIGFTLVLFPGTELHQFCESKGLIEGTQEVKPGLNYQYAPLSFKTKDLNEKNMKKLRNYYIIKQYLNPINFARFLSGFTLFEFYEHMSKYIKVFIKRLVMP